VKTIQVVVETPGGSLEKYDYEPSSGFFKLNKIMPAGLVFPFDFGFIPGTKGGDGDPLDVLVMSEIQTFTGCAVDCRVIGGIMARQTERDGSRMRNDRIVAVPEVSVQYAAIKTLNDLPKILTDQLTAFFENYNAQAGKKFTPVKRLTPAQADKIVAQARDNASKDFQIQLFIPIRDENGKPFPQKYFSGLNTELRETFGGFTVYSRSPATGKWKQDGEKTVTDELIVYEVLLSNPDRNYWTSLKERLERQFKQHELLVLVTKVQKL
jgi:inorganic pyrophosphatase